MPIDSASSPATLRNTMRRVRLEKLWVTKNCQTRRSHRADACATPRRAPALSAGGGLAAGLRPKPRGTAPSSVDVCGSIEHVVCRGFGQPPPMWQGADTITTAP